MPNRVVVTGIGALSSLGVGFDEIWKNILANRSGIRIADHLPEDQLRSKVCGRVWDYNSEDHFDRKTARRQDLFIQYAIVASRLAVKHAQLQNFLPESDKTMAGVCIGSGIGGLATIQAEALKLSRSSADKISPFFVPSSIINMASGMVSIDLGLQGPNFSTVTACASGAHNIIHAAQLIAAGDANIMLTGGSEYSSVTLGMGGFSAMRALSTEVDNPERASRPWDKNRNGFVLSDGSAVLVLESLQHAQARSAPILAELVGYGMTADAFHMTQPDPKGDGARRCMLQALQKAQLRPEDIGYINAHATSTPVGDQVEPVAIKAAFGQHAYTVPVSSTKSMTGHMLGAAGAIEAAFCVQALREQTVPATINCDHPDEGCDLDFVRDGARKHALDYAMSNSFGFGGTNASLIFTRYVHER